MSTQVNQWQSSAGPRQTKAVNEALKALQWRGKSYTEISDYGEHSYTQPVSSPSDACKAEMERIGEQFNWQVTRENYRDVVAAFEAATKALVLPVIDKRSTEEERAEREAMHAENARRDAERNTAIEASKSKLLPKVPAWADALIVAQLDEDQSDHMTDYHSHRTVRQVLIGFRKGKREDFRQLRAAAATFPDTAHMGPGLDDWTVLIYAEPDQGPHSFQRREVWRDDSYEVRHFGTEADAKAAIEAAIIVARQKAEAEMAESGSRVIEPEQCLYGYKLACESVEHRENWSMGGGNYLKGGYRHSSGWKVRSVDRSHLNQYAIEDGLPVAAPAAEKPASAAPVAGNGYQIEQHMHTKHGFEMSLVVLTGRVDRDRFETLRDSCKTAGGWYSRQWGKTPGGFAFKSREVAENWATSALSGQVAADKSSEPSAPPAPSAPSVPITQGIADRLRKLADGMTDKIEHAHRPMTQNITPKRQREYQSRVIEGNQLQRCQTALLALAEAWDAGTVPAALQGLRTKSQILPMVRVRTESNGYYDVHETGEYSDQSEAAKALRALMEAAESPESKASAADRERRQEIERMEHALVGLDIPGFFPTPLPVIERMLDEAQILPEHTVLEPSAGKGDIADLVRERGGWVMCCEISPRLREILKAKGHIMAEAHDFMDFLEVEPKAQFDRILMNPPFEKGQDIDHVQHAYKLLAPGGRLVAIMSSGPFYRSDRKATEFREWIDVQESSVEDLPAGSFSGKDSFRQTGVASKLVVIDKAAVVEDDRDADDELSAAGMEV